MRSVPGKKQRRSRNGSSELSQKLRAFRCRKTQGEDTHEQNYDERWYDNLLERLRQWSGRDVFARMAAEFRCLGRPTPFHRAERFPRGCAPKNNFCCASTCSDKNAGLKERG